MVLSATVSLCLSSGKSAPLRSRDNPVTFVTLILVIGQS
jgi:hypothetical protein